MGANSQRKQSSKASGAIKTDKYGVPLNFGNYKNGRLIVKKKGGGGGKDGGKRDNTAKSKKDSGRGAAPSGKSQKAGQKTKQQQSKNENHQQQKKARDEIHVASVGLTGEAHNVMKEALRSTASNSNLQSLDDGYSNNGTKDEMETQNEEPNNNKFKNNKRNNRHGSSSRSHPDLQPPPAITGCSDPLGPFGDQRRSLPVHSYKSELLSTIASNSVTVIEGETGSGKTTQVPQYVIEDATLHQKPCNIIVAQPRRISAMSVAERVASERNESIGQTVGYTIRLENKSVANTRLLFCTTGILLKRLEEDPLLTNVTHVFVDEVHERSIESDFLLMVLKDALPQRVAKGVPLKVVLMSATLDASLFHDYFDGAPSVKFPGRTFPVTELYLEHALEVTGHVVRGNEDWCRKGGNSGGAKKNVNNGNNVGKSDVKPGDWTCSACGVNNFARNKTCFRCGAKQNQKGSNTSMSASTAASKHPAVVPLEDRDDMELTPLELTARYAKYSPNTQSALGKLDHNAINYNLVADTIKWLCKLSSPKEAAGYLNGNKGIVNIRRNKTKNPQNNGDDEFDGSETDTTSLAVLVFLPGIKEITTLHELLTQSTLSSTARDWILPIHSTIPPEEQRRVFTRPPKGTRKVVLATNIAETAITIDDVAFVVDTGRMKENRYDPLKRMSSLEDCLVAKSNARQRRGRAGRVREGVAVHLFTKHRHDKVAMAAQAPEVQRVPLEQLVLRIKALKYPGTAAEVCARLVEPPAPNAVRRAVEELVFLEAMQLKKPSFDEKEEEQLTALGVHLSTLPVDCRIGKLILLGAMFGVADDALTIAATLSYRNPFMSPMSAREEADRAKMAFATAQSDHLTVLNAYKQVDAMGHARYDFCRENFLSIKTIQTIAGLKRQLLELLSAAGFVRPNLRSRAVESLGRRNGGVDGVALALEKGLGHGRSGRNGGVEDGDWKCPKCNSINFARNTRSCFRCKRPKPKMPVVEKNPVEEGEAVDETGSEEERVLMGADDENDSLEKSLPLLKALLAAALFPQMVFVDDGKSASGGGKKGGGGGGKMTLKAKAEDGEKQEDMALHPSCIAGKVKGSALSSKYLVYHERVKTTRVYIRDATPVSPYALILFGGGKMQVEACPRGGNESVLRIDGWLGFKCPRRDHLLVMELREVLDKILKHKVENPRKDFTEEGAGIIDAVKAILTMDEDGKVVAPQRRADDAFDFLNRGNNGGGSQGGGKKRSGGGGGGGKKKTGGKSTKGRGKGGGGGRGGRR